MLHRLLLALTLLVPVACEKDDGDTDELPPAAEVCAAACANFATCGPSTPDCESDCQAGIEFMAQNNPGTMCATYETGRMDCMSKLTCDELDAYLEDVDDPERPCQSWIDLEADNCAIE